jgi:hypothetical protein
MVSAVFEPDAGSRHEVLHSPRDEDLARLRERSDSGTDVNGDP